MTKGLEALEELRYRITHFNGKFNDYHKIMNTIEQELEDREKKDKALEIIKRTHLNVGAFMLLCKGDHEYTPNTTYEQYVWFCEKQKGNILGDKIHSFCCCRMTKEEYELVLEVLYE